MLWLAIFIAARAEGAASQVTNAIVLAIENKVEVARFGSTVWDPAYIQPTNQVLYQGDRLRTGLDSRALLRLSNLTDFPLGELTHVEIPREQKQRATLRLLRGVIYFFHRDRPGEFQVDTPTVSAVVRGTEFNLEVADDGTSRFQLLDGELEMSNEFGRLILRSGEEAVAAVGQPPLRTAVITASPADVVEWRLYYPGILHLNDLRLSAEEQRALSQSLAAYRSGDLLAALAHYPENRQPVSNDEKIYRAALLLAVGKVDEAFNRLKGLEQTELARALQTVVAAVKFQNPPATINTNVVTGWLAESYAQQSRFDLSRARAAARQAVEIAPDFAFAWTQLAELEFGFGRTSEALAALDKSLSLAPRNAQSLALKGFLLAAENRIAEAIAAFDEAILLDGALGNAWLGRGLCRIRQGDAEAGQTDLLVAATLEPQRGILRSYLGKAFSHAGDRRRALHELDLARQLDPRDPTAWLYSALIKQQGNRINEAVRDLEQSVALNENRRVYRSRLLLDQDRAIRGANLATVYEDAGMMDVGLREAARAVTADYADYSAHLFLASSYNILRDPRRINLRYETAGTSEYLIANLLAPVAAGTLSPEVTQQEYARLFERNRFGLVSSTEYRSRGDWAHNAVQYGILDNFSYTLEEAYRSENGSRPNNDLEAFTATVKLKQQVTPRDNLFFLGSYFTAEAGDLAQYFYQTNARTGLRVKETQEPILFSGWHHEWNPASHTLFLGGYWRDIVSRSDLRQPVLFLRRAGPEGEINGMPAGGLPTAEAEYESVFEGYTAELQHILRLGRHIAVVGSLFQGGMFDTESELGRSTETTFRSGTGESPGLFSSPGVTNAVKSDFQRLSLYAYDTWQIIEPLFLTAGVSYDRLESPVNFRHAPLVEGEDTTERVSPKAGLIWTPTKRTAIRAAYTRSLGGVAFDQSFRLEPSQVAGFNQAFRGLIPESVEGAVAGGRIEARSISLEQKIGSSTYLGVQAEWLDQDAEREIGEIDFADFGPTGLVFQATTMRNRLQYEERNLITTINQLIGRNWSLGARYRLSEADLISAFVELPSDVSPAARSHVSATLHQVNLFALFNHHSGLFGQAESIWLHQSSGGYSPSLPDEEFWQFNVYLGYRFWARRIEARVGLLNLSDQDYNLNPINLMSDLPRERTFVASLRFSF